MNRRILYITGTRADYGIMKETLSLLNNDNDIELHIAATGMHLMPEFGNTINEIRNDNLTIHKINAVFAEDNPESMSRFIGVVINQLTQLMQKIQPDIVLLLGDRGEMLAAAVVATYLTIPVAHIHGGEITSTVDDYARNAITKLAQIHLPATKNSRERIINMGENPANIHVVGAPGLDPILNMPLIPREEILQKYNLKADKPILLVTQHAVSLEIKQAASQIQKTLDAVLENKDHQVLLVYPNADAGGRSMITIIQEYEEKYPIEQLRTYKSIPHTDFLSLLNTVDVMIGNSSSGIIEAPSFHLPVINIGTRQQGRERSENIIDVNYDTEEIKEALYKACNNTFFLNKVARCENPYGDGQTAPRIVEILKNTKINQELLNKTLWEIKN